MWRSFLDWASTKTQIKRMDCKRPKIDSGIIYNGDRGGTVDKVLCYK